MSRWRIPFPFHYSISIAAPFKSITFSCAVPAWSTIFTAISPLLGRSNDAVAALFIIARFSSSISRLNAARRRSIISAAPCDVREVDAAREERLSVEVRIHHHAGYAAGVRRLRLARLRVVDVQPVHADAKSAVRRSQNRQVGVRRQRERRSGALARFSLSAFPFARNDLPKWARDAGLEHESLNFDFAEYGAIFDGKCAIIRRLPNYPIGSIETGQWIPGEGELWSGRVSVGD